MCRAPRRDVHSRPDRALAPTILVGLILVAGCVQNRRVSHIVEPNELRPANGVVLDTQEPNELRRLAEALDELVLRLPAPPTPLTPAAPLDPNAVAPVAAGAGTARLLQVSTAVSLPPKASRLLSLPKLSNVEIREMRDRLALQLGADLGYADAPGDLAAALPLPPAEVQGVTTLTRATEAGALILRFGFRHFSSQPPQLWSLGLLVKADRSLDVNPDLAALEPTLKALVQAVQEMRKGLTFNDLEAKLVQLSYVDDTIALAMLKGMGITTMAKPEEIPAQVDFAKLPYVVAVPDPTGKDVGLIGSNTKTQQTKWGLSLTPGVASEITDNPVVSPMTQLLVVFHPAHPEQFSRVRSALDSYIDRPARQIFIEAMVLEIGEEGLKDLGIDWAMTPHAGNPLSINPVGALNADSSSETFKLAISDLSESLDPFDGKWAVTLRALVREGKAQILSRPSILTLNNRQSTIRVGKDLPIASSYEGLYSSNKVAFNFQYLPTGILLNIRPRINEAGTEVSMLIDTMVSDQTTDPPLEMKASNGEILASAPTISTRRVQTYGRIRNNTPFIIGGLVARKQIRTQDKVPLLGDIPLFGALFRADKTESEKQEVIIVLTPYVLPEKKLIPRSLPKDEDLFDSFGHELFRDSYRIRNEDVFDLSFLLDNARITRYRQAARRAVEANFRLGSEQPYRSFVRDQVPGESILVTRMIYEVIKRLGMGDRVGADRMIYLSGQQVGGYDVDFIDDLLNERAGGRFSDFGDRALALTFTAAREEAEHAVSAGEFDKSPLPEVRMLDCPDRKAWGRLLWELNQRTDDGRDRFTVLIQNRDDLTRLRRALVLKKIAELNGGREQMRLRNFSVGKVLLMPDLKPRQIHLVDIEAARFFFHTEQYYPATLHEIETQLRDLDAQLRRPEIQLLTEDPGATVSQ